MLCEHWIKSRRPKAVNRSKRREFRACLATSRRGRFAMLRHRMSRRRDLGPETPLDEAAVSTLGTFPVVWGNGAFRGRVGAASDFDLHPADTTSSTSSANATRKRLQSLGKDSVTARQAWYVRSGKALCSQDGRRPLPRICRERILRMSCGSLRMPLPAVRVPQKAQNMHRPHPTDAAIRESHMRCVSMMVAVKHLHDAK